MQKETKDYQLSAELCFAMSRLSKRQKYLLLFLGDMQEQAFNRFQKLDAKHKPTDIEIYLLLSSMNDFNNGTRWDIRDFSGTEEIYALKRLDIKGKDKGLSEFFGGITHWHTIENYKQLRSEPPSYSRSMRRLRERELVLSNNYRVKLTKKGVEVFEFLKHQQELRGLHNKAKDRIQIILSRRNVWAKRRFREILEASRRNVFAEYDGKDYETARHVISKVKPLLKGGKKSLQKVTDTLMNEYQKTKNSLILEYVKVINEKSSNG